MVSLDRIRTNANICSIEIAFKGTSIPSAIAGWQPFYNSTFENADFQNVYGSLSSFDYGEESINSGAGTSYKQKGIFRFPATDKDRANRIELLLKTKYLKLNLTSGQSIVIGRNDYFQNTLPTTNFKADHHLCEISIETLSISPSGFVPSVEFGLPTLIPIDL